MGCPAGRAAKPTAKDNAFWRSVQSGSLGLSFEMGKQDKLPTGTAVTVAGRQLMCVCRACYLLFTDADADLRYRAVPDRYLAFGDFALDRLAWEALQIPQLAAMQGGLR